MRNMNPSLGNQRNYAGMHLDMCPGGGRLGAVIWAPPFGRTAVWPQYVWALAFSPFQLVLEEASFSTTY